MKKKDVEVKKWREGGVEFISKTRNKPLTQLDEDSFQEYNPSLLDLLDDLPPHISKHYSPILAGLPYVSKGKKAELQRELGGKATKAKNERRKEEAQRIANALRPKYPNIANNKTKIAEIMAWNYIAYINGKYPNDPNHLFWKYKQLDSKKRVKKLKIDNLDRSKLLRGQIPPHFIERLINRFRQLI